MSKDVGVTCVWNWVRLTLARLLVWLVWLSLLPRGKPSPSWWPVGDCSVVETEATASSLLTVLFFSPLPYKGSVP